MFVIPHINLLCLCLSVRGLFLLLFPIVQYNVLPLSSPQAESAESLLRAHFIQPQGPAEQYRSHESLVGGDKGSNALVMAAGSDSFSFQNIFISNNPSIFVCKLYYIRQLLGSLKRQSWH